MRFGSVCSGIEAASVAFAPLGWTAAWLAEIEPFPSGVLAHHYPDVPNVGDMTAIVRRVLSGEMEAPDLFCGGTPCQAFSVAGKRQSLDDARGNLSLTFCEIADAIDHVRAARGADPCVVLWENVPGVLSTRDNAFGCFLGALAGEDCELQPAGERWTDAGCVYGPARAVAWRVLDAQYFGLAQRRRRVFVVASARDGFDPAAVLFESDGVRRDFAPRREAREGTAADAANRSANGGAQGAAGAGAWRGVAMGSGQAGAEIITDGGAPTLTCLHEAPIVAMPTADTIGCLNAAGGHAVSGNTVQDAMAHQLVPMAFDTTQITSAANYSSPKAGDPCRPLAAGAHAPAVAFSCKDYGADAGEIAPTLRVMGHAGSHPNAGGQVAVAFGGQMSVPQVDVELSQTLQAKNPQAAAIGMAVRRLTPRECERLQGFPDDYTCIPWRGKPADLCPDGPRYKALGNSWAVPCVAWIGRRIARALA